MWLVAIICVINNPTIGSFSIPAHMGGCMNQPGRFLAVRDLCFTGLLTGIFLSATAVGQSPLSSPATGLAVATSTMPASQARSLAAETLRLQPVQFHPLFSTAGAKSAEPAPRSGAARAFAAEGPGFGMQITSSSVRTVLVHAKPVVARTSATGENQGAAEQAGADNSEFSMKLISARADGRGDLAEPSAMTTNYFLGQGPAEWQVGVHDFARLRFHNIYPGIDVAYYGNGEKLEHDFILAPGADPAHIRLAFEGIQPRVDGSGDLVLQGPSGNVRLLKPVAYTETQPEKREPVSVRYEVAANGEVSFALGAYDRAQKLVIDPTLSYASYFGTYSTIINAVALDSAGNILLTGQTYAGFGIPTKNATLTGSTGATYNAFLAKLDPTGATVQFATYVGGNKVDAATGLALDGSGNAYLTGITSSTTFPTLNAYQGAQGVSTCYTSSITCFNAFVTAIKADGSAVIYSTYLGGTTNDQGNAIAVDKAGNATVTGFTQSPNFPLKNAFQTAYNKGNTCSSAGNCQEVFVSNFTAAGALNFSTFLGGSNINAGMGVALDAAGNIYLTGLATSDFPTVGTLLVNGTAAPTGFGGTFITKMAADGQSLAYSYVVRSAYGSGIAVDSTGAAYVVGLMGGGTNLPVTTGAYSSTPAGWYALKVAAGGGSLAYSTYIGGINNATGLDAPTALAVDGANHLWIGGFTSTNSFPMVSPLQSAGAGILDASGDGGATFHVANGGLPATAVSSLLFDPSHAGLLLAAGPSGLYTSSNAGTSWTALATTGLTNTNITTLVRSASSPNTLTAITGAGIFRSADDGASWSKPAGTGLPSLNGTSLTLATDPANANIVYFSQGSVGTPLVWVTTDGGATWASASTGLPSSGNIGFMVADPVNAGTLYAAIGSKVYKTVNYGTAWTLPNASGVTYNIVGLAVDPATPTTVYVGTALNYSKSTDGGTTFSPGNATFNFQQVAITVDPTNSNTLYARQTAAGSWALYKSTNGGTNFSSLPYTNSFPSAVVVDPTNNANIYVVTAQTVTAVLAELDPTGANLLFSTYYGGVGHSRLTSVAIAPSGTVFAGGFTDSVSLTTTNSGGRPSIDTGGANVNPRLGEPNTNNPTKNEQGTQPPGSPTGEGTATGIMIAVTPPPTPEADLSIHLAYPEDNALGVVVTNHGATSTGANSVAATNVVTTVTLSSGYIINNPDGCVAQLVSFGRGYKQAVCTDPSIAVGEEVNRVFFTDFIGGATATVHSATPDPNLDDNTATFTPVPGTTVTYLQCHSGYSKPGVNTNKVTTLVNLGDRQTHFPGTTVPDPFLNYTVNTSGATIAGVSNCQSPTGIGTASMSCTAPPLAPGTNMEIEVDLDVDPTAAIPLEFRASVTDLSNTTINEDPDGGVCTYDINSFAPAASAVALSSQGVTPVDATTAPHGKTGVTAKEVRPRAFDSSSNGTAFAADPAGEIWVTNGGALKEYDFTGTLLGTFSGGGLGAASGMAIDGNGTVWIANSNGTISTFATTGVAVSPSGGFNGQGISSPSAVSVDASGSVWVTNAGNGTVTRFFGAAAPTATPLATNLSNGAPARVP